MKRRTTCDMLKILSELAGEKKTCGSFLCKLRCCVSEFGACSVRSGSGDEGTYVCAAIGCGANLKGL